MNNGLPGGYIYRINIIAINQGIELRGGWRSFISSRWEQGQLLTFLELLQVQNGLGVQTHTGQGLEQVAVTQIINLAGELERKHSAVMNHSHDWHQHLSLHFMGTLYNLLPTKNMENNSVIAC